MVCAHSIRGLSSQAFGRMMMSGRCCTRMRIAFEVAKLRPTARIPKMGHMNIATELGSRDGINVSHVRRSAGIAISDLLQPNKRLCHPWVRVKTQRRHACGVTYRTDAQQCSIFILYPLGPIVMIEMTIHRKASKRQSLCNAYHIYDYSLTN